MKQIKKKLDMYQHHGTVEWWTRLQSGAIRIGLYSMRFSESGTPDFVAIVRNKEKGITCLFIEAKSDTGILSPKQRIFSEKNNLKKDIHVITVRSISEIESFINNIAYDKTNDLPEMIG